MAFLNRSQTAEGSLPLLPFVDHLCEAGVGILVAGTGRLLDLGDRERIPAVLLATMTPVHQPLVRKDRELFDS